VDKTEIACVSGGFPSSQTFLEIKTIETALAVKDGATEIDMVLSVGTFLSGDYETCSDEISEIKASCGTAPLKVILETGALLSAEAIKKASVLSMYAGADFIKTSTGKISIAATPEAAYVMCKAIKEYKAQTGRWVGFKAAGGIKTVDDAVAYYTIVRELLGQEFIDKNLFRIGTSSLANKLVNEILGEEVNPF
jgi:deoxyribose-phosphate aldolase